MTLDGKSWPTGKFVTTDGDSFGPMVRMLFGAIDRDGDLIDLLHG